MWSPPLPHTVARKKWGILEFQGEQNLHKMGSVPFGDLKMKEFLAKCLEWAPKGKKGD